MAKTILPGNPHRTAKTIKKGRLLLGMAISLAICSVSAQTPDNDAQAESPRASIIDEVIVRAQRREQSIHEVPISISAFTGNQLRTLGIADTRDLARAVPGLTYGDSGFTVPIFSIRGVGFNAFSPAAASTVGVYIDEANIPFPIMTKGLDIDIERVEVLKGPQGTLYGRNTTGGLVNYIAAKPTPELAYGFEGSYGRFDRTDLEGYLSGPLIGDELLGRIAYRQIRATEGWQKSLTRPDDRLGEEDKQSARLMLEWSSPQRFFIRFSGNWARDKSDSQAAQAIERRAINRDQEELVGDEAYHPRVREHPLVPKESTDMRLADWPPPEDQHPLVRKGWDVDEEFLMGTLDFNWAISEHLDLHYLGVYQDFEGDESKVPRTGLSVENVEFITSVDIKAHSHELRLSGSAFNHAMEWTAGTFFSDDEVDARQAVLAETNSTGFPLVVTPPLEEVEGNLITNFTPSDGRQKSETRAIFGHMDWQALPTIGLSLAARYNREKRDFQGCLRDDGDMGTQGIGQGTTFNIISISQGGSGGIGPNDCVTMDENGDPGQVVDDQKEDNISGRVAINWTPTDDLLFYTSYSRGFKSGGFPVLFGGTQERQYEPVKQERVSAWEVGSKLALLERRLQFNVAGFWYDYKDKQLQSFIVDPIFGVLDQLANVPDSRVWGAELEVQANPVPGLNLAFAASYIDTEIREFVGINARGNEQDFAGNEFNFTPDWEYTATMNYQRPVTRHLSILLGFDVSYTGESRSTLDGDPTFVMDDYTLVNYRLGLSGLDERWQLTFWGRNVTNEFYVHNINSSGSDTLTRVTGRPQTYGVTLSYHSK